MHDVLLKRICCLYGIHLIDYLWKNFWEIFSFDIRFLCKIFLENKEYLLTKFVFIELTN